MNKLKKIKICVIRNDKIGDMILTLPIIKAIKDNYLNSNISVICSNSNFFLCEEAQFVDTYNIFDSKDKFFNKIKTLINFRNDTYDVIFNFSQSLETFFLLLFGRSKYKSNLIYLTRYGNPTYSKIFQRLITKILNIDYVKVDRNKFFKNKKNFHQTETMYQLVNNKLDIKKPKSFILIPSKTGKVDIFRHRLLIHLSSRWINDEYTEDLFLELLTKLKKKYGKLYLTTDQSSHKSFKKVYQFFKKFNDSNLCKLSKCNQDIIILDRLNFENWRNAIINSKFVITYECGCVHVASMSGVPLLIVYDYKNKPKMINMEYSPLTNKYQKVIASYKMINEEIILKLKKSGVNILDKN